MVMLGNIPTDIRLSAKQHHVVYRCVRAGQALRNISDPLGKLLVGERLRICTVKKDFTALRLENAIETF